VRGDLVERLGRADRLGDIGRGDRGDERQPTVRVAWRAVRRAVAAERRDPAPAPLGEHEQRPGQLGTRPDEHQLVTLQRPGREPQVARGVGDVDVHALLDRSRESERPQPRWHAPAAARRAHHEVGRERLGGATVGPPQHPHAGDPPLLRAALEPEHVAAVPQLDIAQRAHPAADVTLEQRPARD
jgi:hypothetical protein